MCRQNAYKNAIFSETKQFRAMVSINNLHGLLEEPIIGPLKFKITKNSSDFDEIMYTNADLDLSDTSK